MTDEAAQTKAKPSSTKQRRRMLPVWKKLIFAGAVFFVFIVFLLSAIEVTLYYKYPSAGFNGKRDGYRYTWGHKVVENRYGFREKDFEVPKPEGVFRIMVLGDSFTFGQGLAAVERYSHKLETLLRQGHPQRHTEVINFGVKGAPTTEERDILQEHVDAVDPDLVVVGFCLNDPQPNSQGYSVEKEKLEFLLKMTLWPRRVGFPRTAVLLNASFDRLLENTGLVPPWQVALQRTYEPDTQQWQEFVTALRDIKSICDKRGLPPPIFITLAQGTSATRPTDYGNPDEELKIYLKWYRQAENAAREAGMVAVNVVEEFAQQMADEPMGVNPLDTHPSAKCNRIYARKLQELVSPILAHPDAKTVKTSWFGPEGSHRSEKSSR